MLSISFTDTVYICTEDAFPNKRLYQMIESKQTSGILKQPWKDGSQPGDHIFVEHIPDVVSKKLIQPLYISKCQPPLKFISSFRSLVLNNVCCKAEVGRLT